MIATVQGMVAKIAAGQAVESVAVAIDTNVKSLEVAERIEDLVLARIVEAGMLEDCFDRCPELPKGSVGHLRDTATFIAGLRYLGDQSVAITAAKLQMVASQSSSVRPAANAIDQGRLTTDWLDQSSSDTREELVQAASDLKGSLVWLTNTECKHLAIGADQLGSQLPEEGRESWLTEQGESEERQAALRCSELTARSEECLGVIDGSSGE